MKKKICFVNPTVILKRPIAEIIKNIHKEYDIELLIPKNIFAKNNTNLHYQQLPSNVKIETYATISPPLSSEWQIPISPSFLLKIVRMFKRNNIIHMWTYFYISNLFILMLKPFFKKKLILTCDTFPSLSFDAGKLNILFKIYHKFLGKKTFSKPDKIIVYHNYLTKYAKKISGRDDIDIVSTGIDTKPFFNKPTSDIRKELKIPIDTKIILYVGLLIPRKGIDTIIKTISNLKDQKIKMVIVGDGPNRKDYENLTKQLDLEDKIIFTGWRKDVINFYKSADIFFFPSRGEGMPGVIMESMASRLPIVGTNAEYVSALITNNKTGILCKKDNVEEFSKKMILLINDEKLCKQLANKAYESILSFDWKRLIEKYKKMYESI